MKGFDLASELADLRRGWGYAYRITCNDDCFRATHIVSGQSLSTESADGLRVLIREHHNHLDLP